MKKAGHNSLLIIASVSDCENIYRILYKFYLKVGLK